MQTILSVGIDVGTSTTQVVFSRLTMDNPAGYFSVPRVAIVDKQVVYKSEVHLTPLKTAVLIDAKALREIVAGEFRRAGYAPGDTDSGAVIITGESARKENADAVLHSLSGFAGDFVVSAAGPDMESLIAGKGSGAWQYSMEHHCRVANLDIGGGTTNVVLFDDGRAIARGCLDVGGRLICLDRDGRIEKISPAAALAAEEAGVHIGVGQRADAVALSAVAEKMARALETMMGLAGENRLMRQIRTPGSSDFPDPGSVDAICFSGGVADMIYHDCHDTWKYGDIGVLLGQAVRNSRLCTDLKMIVPGETIRATVVGAGTYTTTISGSTISYSDDIFPMKNIPVIKLDQELQQECFAGRTEAMIQRIRWFLEQNSAEQFVLAMAGKKDPDYGEMKRAATAIGQVMEAVLKPGDPILLVIENDIAKAMGQMIGHLPGMKRQIVAIDSIRVEDGEYLDMGRPLMNGMVIPVVVKTLIFG